MTRRWIVIPVVGFSLIAGSVGAYAAWSGRYASDHRSANDTDDAIEAPVTVRAYLRACSRGREAGSQWLVAEVHYAASNGDLPRLLALCDGQEEPYRDNESAAIQTCRALLIEDRTNELQHIRELWRGRETQPAAWLAVDADALLRTGRQQEARELLSQHHFAGADDAGRLARLALAVDNPQEAHRLLGRATALAPRDADVRDCCGQLLEAEGRIAEAVAEYSAALAARGDDWIVRDRLADCYRRTGDCEEAVATWLPAGGVEHTDFAWLRAWFWSRMLQPVTRDWEACAPAVGRLRSLAAYLMELPAGEFWGIHSRRGSGLREPVAARQETYWLHLLALLQEGRENEAAYLVRTSPYHHVSWQPDLDDALDHVLTLRTSGRSQARDTGRAKHRHPFFEQLEQFAAEGSLNRGLSGLPADVARLLTSEEVYAAILLAAGWNQAALLLHHPDADLSRFPDWFGEGILRAEWANRGKEAALASALRQPRTAALDLIAGELLLAQGRRAEGMERFQSALRSGNAGQRAAWLFALAALDEKRPADARRALEEYPQLTNSREGLTLLARCAAGEGNDDRAEQLYRELAPHSSEARAYLAHRALASGDWTAAGQLLREAGR